MRYDVQDFFYSHRRATIAIAIVIVVLWGAAIALVIGAHKTRDRAAATGSSTATAATYRPSYTAAFTPTAFDRRMDASQCSGAMLAEMRNAAALTPPTAAWDRAYPEIAPSARTTAAAYSTAFVRELLDRDYQLQSRSSLARWLVGESAADLQESCVPSAQARFLWVQTMVPTADPAGTQTALDLVPSLTRWRELASEHATWTVSHLLATTDPLWSTLVANGLTSRDTQQTLEEITGTLTAVEGRQRSTSPFSAVLVLGTGVARPGLATIEIDDWKSGAPKWVG